jgi:hypothetical protein
MDKHDRPYRCEHKECEKLQGFTYSGGLLRHEREVHNKHGGPKSKLVCPHVDCKRHSAKGFTRKENLNEHLRRVHDNKNSPSQAQGAQQIARDAENLNSPYAYAQTAQIEDPNSPASKRMRQDMSERSASEGYDLRRENEELKRLLHERDARIVDMENELSLMRGMQYAAQHGQSHAQEQV